jgi:DnaJ-class molecular chaperone
MTTCQECLGEGRIVTETAVVDWSHGGYLREELVECPECQGSGEVEDYENV